MIKIDDEIIKQRKRLLEKINEFSRDSELTEEDAVRIGRKVNKSAAKKFFKK